MTLAAAFAICSAGFGAEQLSTPADADIYPHVGSLESAILGQSYPQDMINDRLSRMEKKAFGNVSAKTDLADRTDDLDQYASNVLHKNLLQANMDVDEIPQSDIQPARNQNSFVTQTPVASTTDAYDYPRVTALEQAILGQTYAGQPLSDRLGRMETKAFGSVSNNLDLSDRTDALETYAEKKLHKQILSKSDSEITSTSNTPGGGGLFSKVGQALIGMAMPNMNGIGGTVGRGGGLGYGGGGLGGSGMGFGPVGSTRRQAAQQKQQEAQAPVHPDDPAVHADTPPDPAAKLIVKVGWCEVKLFGHTCPEIHLPQRLGQINSELKLEPGKSDIQLMDDIGLMIKAVQARKPKST